MQVESRDHQPPRFHLEAVTLADPISPLSVWTPTRSHEGRFGRNGKPPRGPRGPARRRGGYDVTCRAAESRDRVSSHPRCASGVHRERPGFFQAPEP